MRKSKFTEEQQVMALRQAEAGTPVTEICRKLQITEATFYRWKKKFGGLGVPELRELRQLREENGRLEAAGGGSERGQGDPPGGAPKKMVSPAQRREGVAWAQRAYQALRASGDSSALAFRGPRCATRA